MRTLSLLVGLVMLAGCGKAPANKDTVVSDSGTTVTVTSDSTTQTDQADTNAIKPDSFGVVKICKDGTKVYLLQGGNVSGQYAVWDTAGNGSWELLASGTSPETVCS